MATWLNPADCRLEDFRAVCEQKTELADYPHAVDVVDNVLIYPGAVTNTRETQAELARALMDGPGVVVFTAAFAPPVVDRATAVFTDLIAEQKAAGVTGGDHFAKPGANDRVWARWTSSRCATRPRLPPTTTTTRSR
jgi:ABC-type histidine transport system ATPase subunit